jgi:membrane dipeptidase
MPLITEGLVRRGYHADAIAKILGQNWLRVYRQVWGA